MVDIIVYSVITIHLPPLPYLRVVDSVLEAEPFYLQKRQRIWSRR